MEEEIQSKMAKRGRVEYEIISPHHHTEKNAQQHYTNSESTRRRTGGTQGYQKRAAPTFKKCSPGTINQ